MVHQRISRSGIDAIGLARVDDAVVAPLALATSENDPMDER